MKNLKAGEKLKKLRGDQSFREFAKKVGLSHLSIIRFEQGKQNLKYESLKKIADAYSIDVSFFTETEELASHQITVPYTGLVPAGDLEIWEQPKKDPIILPNSWHEFKNTIAVEIIGDSMERLFYQGDILFIWPRPLTKDFKNGFTYVVEYMDENGSRERIVKNLYRHGNEYRLVSENKNHPDIFIPKYLKLFRIVGVLSKFRYQQAM